MTRSPRLSQRDTSPNPPLWSSRVGDSVYCGVKLVQPKRQRNEMDHPRALNPRTLNRNRGMKERNEGRNAPGSESVSVPGWVGGIGGSQVDLRVFHHPEGQEPRRYELRVPVPRAAEVFV